MKLWFLCLFVIVANVKGEGLPTVYEYFTQGGIKSGLVAKSTGFELNGKNVKILSGTIHYFRVHPEYWRDRLRKLRAMGFIAVETVVPWNIHEPEKDVYDFGDGSNDMSEFTDLAKFLKTAQEEDLLVVIRPGPYTCAEWEFGGLPSWLLRAKNFEVRTANPEYLERVKKYFDKLFPILAELQFVKGGPIIAIQVENEYGAMASSTGTRGKQYMEYIVQLQDEHGLNASLQLTSDSPSRSTIGSVDNLLMTVNFNDDPKKELDTLKSVQPNKPTWVMEYWTGWFDGWFGKHAVSDPNGYALKLEQILSYPASVNIYMFHGGTSFGFMSGANIANGLPSMTVDITSYDYEAPLSEAGDYTEKYNRTSALAAKYNPIKLNVPARPSESVKYAYPTTPVTHMLTFDQLLALVPSNEHIKSTNVVAMEKLDINNDSGQSYGFVVYRKTGLSIAVNSTLQIQGKVHDVGILLFNSVRQTEAFTNIQQSRGFGYFDGSNAEFTTKNALSNGTMDIVVENWARVNYGYNTGYFNQWKGLWEGDVLLNNVAIKDWEIIPLQLKRKWVQSLTGWQTISSTSSPTLYKATLTITTPYDTFINMSAWGKGNVFVNGFNVGRYFSVGPQQTLYVPAPLLKKGTNEILVFEMYTPAKEIVFSSAPIYSQ